MRAVQEDLLETSPSDPQGLNIFGCVCTSAFLTEFHELADLPFLFLLWNRLNNEKPMIDMYLCNVM